MAVRRAIWPRPHYVVITKLFSTAVGFSFVPRNPLRFFGRFSPLVVFRTKPAPPAPTDGTFDVLTVKPEVGILSVTDSSGTLSVKQ